MKSLSLFNLLTYYIHDIFVSFSHISLLIFQGFTINSFTLCSNDISNFLIRRHRHHQFNDEHHRYYWQHQKKKKFHAGHTRSQPHILATYMNKSIIFACFLYFFHNWNKANKEKNTSSGTKKESILLEKIE
ncbi:hypothetical protein DERP_009705 [Dermatophagoides pteronyssinus]|uniref:Uncharacterized protein n=1 Tax=Dermatophagoides pteronyssinus TaxID=6956 RepID=A0ABQ8JAL5_DERPT|nr:hypothetical protein DERP_009705 [Dermatophagoides pteronyssinus]